MDIYSAIVNLNTVLILLGTGLSVWLIRQLVPDNLAEKKIWRVFVRLMPVLIGIGLSFIPGLHPMENVSQSVIVGAIAGSLSSSTYEVIRELLGKRIKLILGSPQARKKDVEDFGE